MIDPKKITKKAEVLSSHLSMAWMNAHIFLENMLMAQPNGRLTFYTPDPQNPKQSFESYLCGDEGKIGVLFIEGWIVYAIEVTEPDNRIRLFLVDSAYTDNKGCYDRFMNSSDDIGNIITSVAKVIALREGQKQD